MVSSIIDPISQRIAHNVVQIRQARGLTQIALSVQSGISIANIRRVEKGGNPTVEVLEAIAAALDCDIIELVKKA